MIIIIDNNDNHNINNNDDNNRHIKAHPKLPDCAEYFVSS